MRLCSIPGPPSPPLRPLQEPEVVDLADFLTSCGAQIRGAGSNTMAIKGVPQLGPTDFTIIPDRIEAGTFLAAAAITRSALSISPVVPRHLTAVVSKLRAVGCRIHQTRIGTLKVSGEGGEQERRSCRGGRGRQGLRVAC